MIPTEFDEELEQLEVVLTPAELALLSKCQNRAQEIAFECEGYCWGETMGFVMADLSSEAEKSMPDYTAVLEEWHCTLQADLMEAISQARTAHFSSSTKH